MKYILRALIILLMAGSICACEKKDGTLQIQNNINQVKLTDIYWADQYVTYELIPGETASINIQGEDLPLSGDISFRMTAEGKTIFLRTKEEYSLSEDQEIEVILDDDTEVINPNE